MRKLAGFHCPPGIVSSSSRRLVLDSVGSAERYSEALAVTMLEENPDVPEPVLRHRRQCSH